MQIYIEGLDKVGKTTLARKLCHVFPDYQYRKFNQPSKDWYDELSKFVLGDEMVICDRSPLGQSVYGKIYRKIDESKEYSLWNIMKSKNIIFIYMTEEKDVLLKRFADEKEDFVKPSEIDAISNLYESVFSNIEKNNIFRVIRYNSNQPIEELLQKLVSPQPGFKNITFNYSGSKTPNILFLGESFNNTNKERINAVPFDFGRSASYLKKLIPIEKNVGYLNVDDTATPLVEKIDILKPQTIVSFGKIAQKQCDTFKIKHIPFIHPAHICRYPDKFRTVKKADWENKLLSLLEYA